MGKKKLSDLINRHMEITYDEVADQLFEKVGHVSAPDVFLFMYRGLVALEKAALELEKEETTV